LPAHGRISLTINHSSPIPPSTISHSSINHPPLTILRRPWPAWLFVLAVGALALGLRLFRFMEPDIWQDEANEIFICEGTWGETLSRIEMSEMRPPVRYVFLKLWLLGGRGTHYLRLPSLVLSVASVFLLYLIVRRALSEETARLAALLMACASFPISSAHFCRSYSTDAFVTLLAVHAFLRHEDLRSVGNRLYAIFAVVLAVYTSYFFDFVLAVMLLFSLVPALRHGGKWRDFLTLYVPVGLLTCPLLLLAPEQWSHAKANQWHAGGADMMHLLGYFRVLGAGRIKNWDFAPQQDFAALLCVLLAAAGAWSVWKTGKHGNGPSRSALFLVGWFFLPVTVIYLVSQMSLGLFTIEVMIVYAPAYYALVAAGIRRIESNPGRILVVLLFGVLSLYSFGTTRDLRYLTNGSCRAAETLREVIEPDEWVVHASHFSYFPMRFYGPELSHTIFQETVPWNWGASQVLPGQLLTGLERVRERPGFWLVRKRNHYREDYDHWLAQIRELAASWTRDGETCHFVASNPEVIGELILTHYSRQTARQPEPPLSQRVQRELQNLRRVYQERYGYGDEWVQRALQESKE
jgi:hypothetical protein